MSPTRRHHASPLGLLALLVFAVLLTTGYARLIGGGAQDVPVPAGGQANGTTPLPAGELAPRANIVRQGFPAGKADVNDLTKSETAWVIEWELTHPTNRPFYPPGSVLRIKSAKFMFKDRDGKPKWVTVARMLELAEIYVPYDNGYTAFLDVHDMPFYITAARPEFLGPACVAPGEILTSPNPAWSGTVHKEVHDDGIRWMSAETSYRNRIADRARRGEKMILWSCYYGANYRYLIEYGFGDDGMLSCRIGPTGRNIYDRRPDHGDTHLHIGCWRFEPDLGDPTAPPSLGTREATAASASPRGRESTASPLSPVGERGGGEGVTLPTVSPLPLRERGGGEG